MYLFNVFFLKESSIKNSGIGVFLKPHEQPIRKGKKLFDYEGILLGGERERSFRSDRSFNLGDGYEIFGTGFASFINDGLEDFPSNCIFVQEGLGKDSKVYVVSSCDIYPGDELFVSYGEEFWNIHRRKK